VTRARPPTPAERAVARSGYTVRQLARHFEVQEETLARQLRKNDVRSHGLARLLAALCGCGIWCFHPLALAREREKR